MVAFLAAFNAYWAYRIAEPFKASFFAVFRAFSKVSMLPPTAVKARSASVTPC